MLVCVCVRHAVLADGADHVDHDTAHRRVCHADCGGRGRDDRGTAVGTGGGRGLHGDAGETTVRHDTS